MKPTETNLELTPADQKQLQQRGIPQEQFEGYYKILKKGFPFIELHGNAEPGKEILIPSDEEKSKFRERYRNSEGLDVLKFVPASGAASRMFRELYTFLKDGRKTENVSQFIEDLPEYAFFDELMERSGLNIESLSDETGQRKVIEFLLSPEGMDYGNQPKGMIKFHRYSDGHTRTAFEEHFHEGVNYAKRNGKVRIHFTVPEENKEEVENHLNSLTNCLSEMYEVDFEIETSVQKPSTDTPAIYTDGDNWVRTEDDNLLFRPAGHGALIENLNELSADVAFVKNIDNVVPDRLKPETVENKELLGGILLEVREELFKFCQQFEKDEFDRDACTAFLEKWFRGKYNQHSDKELYNILNRPLRVCGMVKNEGEPGGGPFLVEEKGNPSLQIVEKAQIDTNDKEQAETLSKASHFNPVDLVLSLKDHNGDSFDLLKYRNENTGMVVDKTYEGQKIKALELPGLWNGAMHYWNTIFVEVPIVTFNPVKTVFDLRRSNHR